MDSKIIYGVILLLTISTGTVFAQDAPMISLQTNDKNYDEGDRIIISGEISTIIGKTPVTLQIFSEGNLLEIAQLTVAQDGTFSHTVLAEGPLWKNQGEYVVRGLYGERNVMEVIFNYTPKSKIIETTTNFEVDAGNNGTFDVKYTIKGGNLKDIIVNSDIFGLVVKIDAPEDGVITIDLPREFIGAEKQNGKDEIFIILIDGIEVPYQESVVLSESRVITIEFEPGDSNIEIIGTYVTPEFGTIAMIILMIGISSTVLISRNRFN